MTERTTGFWTAILNRPGPGPTDPATWTRCAVPGCCWRLRRSADRLLCPGHTESGLTAAILEQRARDLGLDIAEGGVR